MSTFTENLTAGKFWGLRRLADRHGRFKMLAVDQRPPIKNRCAEAREEVEARFEDVRAVKASLMKVLGQQATATLADPHYALVDALSILPPSSGLIGTLEDSQFIETDEGRVSKEIDDWSVGKIKRVGCDGVKVLTWYRPDASEANKQSQRDFSKRVGEACAKHDIPYIYELLLYPLPGEANQSTDYKEQVGKRADQVVQSVADFAGDEYGVDLFKLESPIPAAELAPFGSDDAAQAWFDQLDEAANRPWVMLSAGANQDQFDNVLDYAFAAGASGFLAGRAIWWQAFNEHFPNMERLEQGLHDNGLPYFNQLSEKADRDARAWMEWLEEPPIKNEAGSFRHSYASQNG